MMDLINTIPEAYNSQKWLNRMTYEKMNKQYEERFAKSNAITIFNRNLSSNVLQLFSTTVSICEVRQTNYGVHSSTVMEAAGFIYTGVRDTAKCTECGLEVSDWTLDMKPFSTHMQRSPRCSYVIALQPKIQPFLSTSLNYLTTSDSEKPLKRQKIEVDEVINQSNNFNESQTLVKTRKRTFSHWPHRTSPSSAQMIEAGFFNCNVGDRVICLYCNLICQQWTPNVDNPWEIHKTLSPKCPYVVATLKQQQTASIRIVNEDPTRNGNTNQTNTDLFRSNDIVYTAACHANYIEIPRRHASFDTWPAENAPSADDLVRAGFFYTGTRTIVTCFYCNGSLQNWGANDNPMIEHARWFPHCAYAKQLCGTDLHRKIQESKRAQQERARANDGNTQNGTGDGVTGRGQLHIPDESTLSRFVAARLDLPISQRMLDLNFKLSVIKRCWEDQLRLKRDDFVYVYDLFLACIILQKQIDRIDGKKENITVPSVAMKRLREREQEVNTEQNSNSVVNTNSMETSVSSDSANEEESNIRTEEKKQETVEKTKEAEKDASTEKTENLCVLCLEEQRRLACIPCGHLATCVPCGHSLRSCPICRTAIDAFVRIYL